MAHLSGTDRAQLLLLSEVVDDYVGPDNPVRFLEAFVDGLPDLSLAFASDFCKVAKRVLLRRVLVDAITPQLWSG